jgi:hypothetical protein
MNRLWFRLALGFVAILLFAALVMYDPGELTALHDHKLIALFVTFAALAFHWWNTYQARPENMR